MIHTRLEKVNRVPKSRARRHSGLQQGFRSLNLNPSKDLAIRRAGAVGNTVSGSWRDVRSAVIGATQTVVRGPRS
jgi:hypothetical protein